MKVKKIFFGALIILGTLVFATVIIGYFMFQSSLPDYNGELEVEGIKNEIIIYRDSNAIPLIQATDELEAAFALGYVHAQERMFQMDLMRRAGMGRLSEILGVRTLPYDKMFRTIGLDRTVKEHYLKLSELSRSFLEYYSRGVNHYLESKNSNYSIEFDLLGYKPEKWTPLHSLLIAKLMAWELNISWWTDIAFTHIIQKLGEDKVKDIIPNYKENLPTIIPKHISNNKLASLDFVKTDIEFRKMFGFTGTHIGSNNWVVNSYKSESNKPIIANDPHLAFQIPGKWFIALIKSPTWNVEGFTLPGLPAVVIGKNENISWVVTNVMTDDADFYFEKIDTSGTKYFYDNRWNNLQIIKDTIKTKDGDDYIFEIKSTHRGPIISDIHISDVLFPKEEKVDADISMRWSALDFSDELNAILKINHAGNWQQFLEGTKDFTVPGQNFVYADIFGNIGYSCATRIPLRKDKAFSFIYDGTIKENDWRGYLNSKRLPVMLNPEENFIASANNKTIKSFPYHISNLWEPSSRIERIRELLQSKEQHSVNDFKTYQNDIYSKYAEQLVPFILQAFENIDVNDENLKITLDLFAQWDFKMDLDYQTPSIYLVFFQKLMENIFKDEMNDLYDEYVFIANIPYRVIPDLLEKGNSTWFDNVNTEETENKNGIIRKSLTEALDYLETEYGKNLAEWQWRELHKVTFKHFFNGFSPLLDKIVNVGPFEVGGDGTTINNTEYSFNDPYNVKLGASMRYIYDFNEKEKIYLVLPTGQSGHIFSEHYSDMTERWISGEYIEISTQLAHWKKNYKNKLVLTPFQ